MDGTPLGRPQRLQQFGSVPFQGSSYNQMPLPYPILTVPTQSESHLPAHQCGLQQSWKAWVENHKLEDWTAKETREREKYLDILSQELVSRRLADTEKYTNSLKVAMVALLYNQPVNPGTYNIIHNLSDITEKVRAATILANAGQMPINGAKVHIDQAELDKIIQDHANSYANSMLPTVLRFDPVKYGKSMTFPMAGRTIQVATNIGDEPIYFGHRRGDYVFSYTSMHKTGKDARCRFRYDGQVPRTKREYEARLNVVKQTVYNMLNALLFFTPYDHSRLSLNIAAWPISLRFVRYLKQRYRATFASKYQPSEGFRHFIQMKVLGTEAATEFAWLMVKLEKTQEDEDVWTLGTILEDLAGNLEDIAGYFSRRQKMIAETILFGEQEYNERVAVYKGPKNFVQVAAEKHPDALDDPLVNIYSGPQIAEELFQINLTKVYHQVTKRISPSLSCSAREFSDPESLSEPVTTNTTPQSLNQDIGLSPINTGNALEIVSSGSAAPACDARPSPQPLDQEFQPPNLLLGKPSGTELNPQFLDQSFQLPNFPSEQYFGPELNFPRLDPAIPLQHFLLCPPPEDFYRTLGFDPNEGFFSPYRQQLAPVPLNQNLEHSDFGWAAGRELEGRL